MTKIWQRRVALAAARFGRCWQSQPAFAAGEVAKGPSDVIFIAQILALMIVGRLLGEAMLRLKQPAVMGQLIAGLLLGPSLVRAAAARHSARTVSRRTPNRRR